MDHEQLFKLKKYFFSCVAVKDALKKEQIDVFTWEFQDELVNETVNNPLNAKYPVKTSFQHSFLKTIIDFLTEGNINISDSLFDSYGKLFTTPEAEYHYKHYLIERSHPPIIIKESPYIISRGTTGLCTWEAAFYLAEWGLANKQLLANKSILELGSGVGLTGICIAKYCSPAKITLSDCHKEVLSNLEENVKINVAGTEDSVAIVETLDWERVKESSLLTLNFDFVIGADIVYDTSVFNALLSTLCSFVTDSNSAFLSLTKRNPETINKFLLLAEKLFDIEEIQLGELNIFLCLQNAPVKMYKLNKKSKIHVSNIIL